MEDTIAKWSDVEHIHLKFPELIADITRKKNMKSMLLLYFLVLQKIEQISSIFNVIPLHVPFIFFSQCAYKNSIYVFV